MKKFVLFAFLTLSTISLTSCSNDDDSKTDQNNIVEKRLIQKIIKTNNLSIEIKLIEDFTYNTNGFVSEIKSYNTNNNVITFKKYQYFTNSVIEQIFENDKLVLTTNYKFEGDTYSVDVYNSNNNLISTSISKIKNKKIVSTKMFNTLGSIIQNSFFEYNNDLLTEIETDSITKTKITRNYLRNINKTFNTPFSYLVTNDKLLYTKVEALYLDGYKRKSETSYEFDKDNYPTKIDFKISDGFDETIFNTYDK